MLVFVASPPLYGLDLAVRRRRAWDVQFIVVVALWVVAGLAAVADWALVWTRSESTSPWRWLTKLLPVALFASIVAVADRGMGAARPLLVAGLVACLAGDALLLLGPRWFVAGLSAFLVGHVVYIAAFIDIDSQPSPWSGLSLIVLPLAARIAVGARATDRRLFVPVVAYVAVILGMYVAAAGTREGWIVAGGALFLASDSVLGWNRFVERVRWMPLVVMVTYHGAQACFAAWAATN